jgi:hypothetical protein
MAVNDMLIRLVAALPPLRKGFAFLAMLFLELEAAPQGNLERHSLAAASFGTPQIISLRYKIDKLKFVGNLWQTFSERNLSHVSNH